MLPIFSQTINCRTNANYLEEHLAEFRISALLGHPAAVEIVTLAQQCLDQPSETITHAFYLALDEYRRGRLN